MQILYRWCFAFAPFFFLSCILKGCNALSCIVCDSLMEPECFNNNKSALAEHAKECSVWCQGHGGFITGFSEKRGSAGTEHKYPPIDCPPAEQFTSCRKIWQSMYTNGYNDGKTEQRIIRACGYIGNQSQQTQDFRSSETTKSQIFTCFSQNCNAGPRSLQTFSCSAIQLAIISTLFYHLLQMLH